MFLKKLNDKEQKSFLDLAYYTMIADKCIAASESMVFKNFQEEVGLDTKQYPTSRTKTLDSILAGFNNSSETVKKIVLFELWRMIFADNHYHENQKKVIETLANAWKMNQDKLDEILHVAKEYINMTINIKDKLLSI